MHSCGSLEASDNSRRTSLPSSTHSLVCATGICRTDCIEPFSVVEAGSVKNRIQQWHLHGPVCTSIKSTF